ncbi:MAG: hypothetical protein OER04_13530 [Cyclobacteriaceae bacterium]|nr:hypothetical protein [Cyclobacteriaceae bacterium]
MPLKHWIQGILWGILGSALVSAIMAYQDWNVNPNGIFHNEQDGTNWTFVSDTFLSWFWPLLPWLILIAWVILYLMRRLIKVKRG